MLKIHQKPSGGRGGGLSIPQSSWLHLGVRVSEEGDRMEGREEKGEGDEGRSNRRELEKSIDLGEVKGRTINEGWGK